MKSFSKLSVSTKRIIYILGYLCAMIVAIYLIRKLPFLERFEDKQEVIKPFDDYDVLPRPFVALYDDQGRKLKIVLISHPFTCLLYTSPRPRD